MCWIDTCCSIVTKLTELQVALKKTAFMFTPENWTWLSEKQSRHVSTRSSPHNSRTFIFCKESTRFQVMAYPYGASWSNPLYTSHSVGLLWTSDQPEAETSIWQHTTLTTGRYPCSRGGFEPTITATERLQTHALDRVATGIGHDSRIQGFI